MAKNESVIFDLPKKGHELNQKPNWYHTVTTNCTTAIYQLLIYLIDEDSKRLPFGYRVLVSGKLLSYLIKLGVIHPKYELANGKNCSY